MGLRVENGVIVEDGPGVKAEFYTHPRKVGPQKWEPTTYIKVRARGARDFVSRRATDADKADFPEAWALFQRGETGEGGTPLTMLPARTEAYELELEVMGIESVEALAELDSVPEDESGEPKVHLAKMLQQAKRYVQLKEETDGVS